MFWRLHVVPALLLILLAGSPAHAAKTIFKCVQNGQTILADHPCEATSASDAAAAPGSPLGYWHGQVQFGAKENGKTVPSAHSVATLALELTPDGKVSGSSADSACKLRGGWTDGGTPHVIALDVVLSECRSAAQDRRYTGALIVSATDASAELSLVAGTPEQPQAGAKMYDVKGTMRH